MFYIIERRVCGLPHHPSYGSALSSCGISAAVLGGAYSLPSDLLLDFFFIPAAYVISVSSVFSSSFSLKHRHLVEKYIVIIELQFMTIDFGPYNNSIQYWYFTRSCQQGLNAQAIDNSIVHIVQYMNPLYSTLWDENIQEI